MARSKSDLKTKIFSSKIFIVCAFIVLVIVGTAAAKEFYKKHQIQKEISFLEEEIEKVEESNKEFVQLIEFLKTESYLEREARLKLNLQKSGEKVVVVSQKSNDILQDEPENKFESKNKEEIITEEKNPKEISNPRKWWNHIFADK